MTPEHKTLVEALNYDANRLQASTQANKLRKAAAAIEALSERAERAEAQLAKAREQLADRPTGYMPEDDGDDDSI